VGGAGVLKQIQTPGRLNDGKTLTYAWGLEVREYRGLPVVEHGGALGGYRAHLMRFPQQHTSVAVLCNLAAAVPAGLARSVAERAIGDVMKPLVIPPGVVGSILGRTPDPVPRDRLREFAGTYYSPELEVTFQIDLAAAGPGLTLQRGLEPSSAALTVEDASETYRSGSLLLHFQRNASGSVTGFTVDSGRVRGIVFERR
jgi:hypothetical protein